MLYLRCRRSKSNIMMNSKTREIREGTRISPLEYFMHEFVSRSPVNPLALCIAIFRNMAFYKLIS